ncbi:MAG: cytochrome c oxidase subunit 3 [Bacteroidota bacterium]
MADVTVDKKALQEGERPIFNASFGKLMMWFFLVSDAFTFSALLIAYGALRVRSVTDSALQAWANPEAVFTHTPILYEIFHIEAPLVFVGLMTFILIISSVTMVLAVEAGHRKSKKEVSKWVFLTIIGGTTFLLCQAYEWYHFIHGHEHSAVAIPEGQLASLGIEGKEDLIDHHVLPALYMYNSEEELIGFRLKDGTLIKDTEQMAKIEAFGAEKDAEGHYVNRTHGGANLKANEYGPQAFGDLFFFVTGFHGTHVFSGVVLLVILYIGSVRGTYEKRGHYEMVEKIGLYWHFVDLVWVFVFTFFYLV